ncbi:Sialin [Aphelenchoides avenae]|nr:Sialin [Aphelenchus avenae]
MQTEARLKCVQSVREGQQHRCTVIVHISSSQLYFCFFDVRQPMAGSGKPGLFCSFRLIFSLTALVGMTLLYILRQNIGVAGICMTHEEPVNVNYTGPQQCPLIKRDGDIVRKDGPFNWKPEIAAQVTFSFYYGYTALQIPGALLGSYIGPKMMITFTVAGSAALVLAMPQAAYMGAEVLIIAQVLSGIAQSAAFPVMQTMIASWAPPEERTTITAIVYTAALGLSVFTIALGFVPCGKVLLAVILSSAGVGLASAQYAGHITSYTDIAPAYSGIISSVTNTVSCAAGFAPSFIIGKLVPTGDHKEWQVAFYVCAGVTMFGAIVYCIFIQGEVQSWAIAEENVEHADSSAASMSSDKQQDQTESTSLEV